MRKLFSDFLNSPYQSFDLHVDNQGAIKLGNNPIHNEKSKHIDVKFHFIRFEIRIGVVHLIYVPTSSNLADMFTKALSRVKLDKLNARGV